MKVLLIQSEKNGKFYYDYFVRISHGQIITTADIESATRYKNTLGCAIAKGLIRRWGHDCLLLIEDIDDIKQKKNEGMKKTTILKRLDKMTSKYEKIEYLNGLFLKSKNKETDEMILDMIKQVENWG